MPIKPSDPAVANKKPVEYLKFFFRLLDIPGWNHTLVELYGSFYLRASDGKKDTCWVKHGDPGKELRLKNRTHVLDQIRRLQDLVSCHRSV